MTPLAFDPDGLRAVLADPNGFGDDVAFKGRTFRGILSREPRMQDDGSGLQVQVWVTTLLVEAAKLPAGVKDDGSSTVTIGEQAYRVRRVGPVDSGGQRELLLVEQ